MSEQEEKQNKLNQFDQFEEEVQNILDPYKLLIVFKRSFMAMLLISLITFIGVIIYIRYAKPVYESSSIIQLENNNRTNSLGILSSNVAEDEGSSLVRELEIIKSPIVRAKVIAELDLSISYYIHGNILFEEKYKNSPYIVSFVEDYSKVRYDQHIDVNIVDSNSYVIELKESEIKGTFGKLCKTPFGNFTLSKTPFFNANIIHQRTFFTFNSTNALNQYFQKNLFVDISSQQARTLFISFKDNNQYKAYCIVKTIDSIYFEQTLQLKLKSFDQSIEFLNTSIQKAEENLIEAEIKFENFMRKNKTMDVMADYAKYSKLGDENEVAKKSLEFKLSILKNLGNLIEKNKDLEEFIPLLPDLEDEQLVKAIENLNALNQAKDNLLLSQSENTHAYKVKKTAAANAKVDALSMIEQNKQVIQKQVHDLNLEKFQIESSIMSFPAKETEMSRLKRHYNLYDKFYGLLMDKLVEQGLTKAGVTVNFVILSPPIVENIPIYPKKGIILFIGVGIAILLSLLLVVVRFLMYDTITTLAELERSIPIPIIGSVPEYVADKMLFSQLIVDKNSKSAISESLRSVRTNLEFISTNKKSKVITVTSTVGGEGKTFVAVNLAAIIAMSHHKVVVLDLDMRKPKIHLAFGAENKIGLSTILIEKNTVNEAIQHSRVPDLDFITAGPTPPNPSELILLPTLNELLDNLKARYDVIIIDTPPVGIVTDGMLLMTKADIPLYIVRINYSKFFVAQEIKRALNRGGYNKLRVIANGVPVNRGFRYNYGYYENEAAAKEKNFFQKIVEKL
ncbi:exopolysaccharide transport family protein [Cytophaga hutchinsonii]|uniref:exopolysaccharide transport family protein n=1 Tax=Cytophaga hutchinsonii TaxID=985 RepID=UPI000038E6AA|nr:tyrosine-protein kinase [Cytophaga hutchinsonii]SFX45764.1 capsular exopolysaccharide family [Cytophaga hutchinsonii ATCC 33406]